MADTVDLGDIGLEENSSRVDKFLRSIADGSVPLASLPLVDEDSPNIDKLLNFIARGNGMSGGSTTTGRVGVWYNNTFQPNDQYPVGAQEGDYYLNTVDKK